MNRLNDLALSARDVPAYMQAVGQAARAAARVLAAATTQSKNAALASAAPTSKKIARQSLLPIQKMSREHVKPGMTLHLSIG